MTPSKQCKRAGLKGLTHMSRLCNKPTSTLRDWHRDNPKLFNVVVIGCVSKFKGEE